MPQTLFRKQAIHHATRRLDGQVIIITPVATWLIGSLLILILTAGVAFAATAEYARKESVPGWLVPEAGAVRVTALRGGIVDQILVTPGDTLSAGDPIAQLSLSVVTDAGDLGETLEASFAEQLNAAEERFNATARRLDAETTRLNRQRDNALVEQAALADQQRVLDRRISVTRENEVWARQNFEEGLTTRADAESWTAVLMELEQDRSALKLAYARYQTQIEDLGQQLAAIAPQQAAAEAELAAARASLDERLTRTGSETTYQVTSPIDGRVETISVEPGQTIGAGTSMAVLTPKGSSLIAELYVPSRAIGFVKPGQSVRLKYDAFPFQRFGTGLGQVTDVSRTVLAPGEVSMAGIQPDEPVFRVRVALQSTRIEAYGDSVDLRSGMMLSAEIVIDRRSLLEWLLDPLYAAGRR